MRIAQFPKYTVPKRKIRPLPPTQRGLFSADPLLPFFLYVKSCNCAYLKSYLVTLLKISSLRP